MLTLEGFQAGLSWLTILRKRDAFRSAFAGFDPGKVARFDERDQERLLADAGIVRNRAKIAATIANAAAFQAVAHDFGSFAAYLADRLLRILPGSVWIISVLGIAYAVIVIGVLARVASSKSSR
jgi:DNA-3-methyladenine glycosylase I